MAQWALNRPAFSNGTKATQFTGSNIPALQVDFPSTTFTDNGDGTWDVSGAYTLHVTDWVIAAGIVVADADLMISRQIAGPSDKYAFQGQLTALANPERRVKDVAIPALTLLSPKTTLTCTFDTAMPDANYEVDIVFEGAASLVGSLNPPMVVSGSKTAAGFQFAVSALLAITVGTLNARCHAVQTP